MLRGVPDELTVGRAVLGHVVERELDAERRSTKFTSVLVTPRLVRSAPAKVGAERVSRMVPTTN